MNEAKTASFWINHFDRKERVSPMESKNKSVSAADKLRIAKQLQSARRIQSDYDKLQAALKRARESGDADAANNAAKALYDYRAETKAIDVLITGLEIEEAAESVQQGTVKPRGSAIQSYFMARQNYYIGFHADYGVMVAFKIPESSALVPMQLLSRKSPVLNLDGTTPSRNLSESDFRAILSVRPSPSLTELQNAYVSTVKGATVDNSIPRMSLDTATVVW